MVFTQLRPPFDIFGVDNPAPEVLSLAGLLDAAVVGLFIALQWRKV